MHQIGERKCNGSSFLLFVYVPLYRQMLLACNYFSPPHLPQTTHLVDTKKPSLLLLI